jgi:hypothetical protein
MSNAGARVDVAWEMRADSPTGAVTSHGQMTLDIPLGSRAQATISVMTPAAGSTAYLVPTSSKNGVELFREDTESLQLQRRLGASSIHDHRARQDQVADGEEPRAARRGALGPSARVSQPQVLGRRAAQHYWVLSHKSPRNR